MKPTTKTKFGGQFGDERCQLSRSGERKILRFGGEHRRSPVGRRPTRDQQQWMEMKAWRPNAAKPRDRWGGRKASEVGGRGNWAEEMIRLGLGKGEGEGFGCCLSEKVRVSHWSYKNIAYLTVRIIYLLPSLWKSVGVEHCSLITMRTISCKFNL